MRAEAITRIAEQIRRAQAEGYCPGVDPALTASALSAMLEHFCYIWLGQGGEQADVQFDDERALDAVATIWVQAVYWRPEIHKLLSERARGSAPYPHRACTAGLTRCIVFLSVAAKAPMQGRRR